MNKNEDFWTPARTAELRERVRRGESYGLIAKSWGVTKNTCIGKGQRIGLGKLKPKAASVSNEIPTTNHFPGAGRCVFPIGHPGEPGFHFCADRARPFGPYCVAHHAVAYMPPKPVPAEQSRLVARQVDRT